MGIDLNNIYDELRPHIGHKIVAVCYGDEGGDPYNIALECETCGEVLVDADKEPEPPERSSLITKAYYTRQQILRDRITTDDRGNFHFDVRDGYILNMSIETEVDAIKFLSHFKPQEDRSDTDPAKITEVNDDNGDQ